MDTFNALSDPTRRTIIEILAKRGSLNSTEIYSKFPISHPAISQHLKILRDAKLVRMKKHAQHHIYSVNTETINDLGHWFIKLSELWEDRMDRLDKMMQHKTHMEETEKEVTLYERSKH